MDQWYERADHFLRDQEISAMDQNEIFVISGEQITSMAYELCLRADLAGRIRSSCGGKNPLIALKPNLVGPIPASDGATTHPQIVEGVIRYLRSEGLQNLVLMESSWVGDKTEDALLVTGFGELSRKLGVPFRDLQADRSVPVDCAGMKLNVCRKALEADFLINLPVMKGHCQTRMTCALKNMKGCIPGSEKRRFHRMGLHEPIGHLSAGLKQGFILADAICPDLTFEDGGNPVTLNTLLCAVDPVLLDAYACRLIGLKEESVPYIRIASECGVGKRDLSAAKVTHFLEKRENGEVCVVDWCFNNKIMASMRKIYVLTAEDEDGEKGIICASSTPVVTDENKRTAIREQLEEYLPIKEEEDAEVKADFELMISSVLDYGKAGTWLDYLVVWEEINLID